MICQENVSTIIMLTELVENGIKKSEQYWPDSLFRYGHFLIYNMTTKYYPDYVHRQLKMVYYNKTHFVQHFQYLTWPDHGIPLYRESFIKFIKEVINIPQNNSPIVVHCK